LTVHTMLGQAASDTQPVPYRVGFLIETVAGWATYRENLERVAQKVPMVDAQWHDVTFEKPGGWIEKLRDRLRVLPVHQTAIVRAIVEFHRGLREGPYEAILTNSGMSVLFSPRLRKTPTLLVVDSTQQQLDEMKEYGVIDHSSWGQKLKLRLRCRTFDAAALVLATSQWAKDGVVGTYGVPEDKVVVNPHGVDLSFWRPRDDPAARGDTVRRVLFVGGDFRRKGGELLLDWIRRRPVQDVELHVVTRDPVAPTPCVVVHDDIGPNSRELLQLYQEADVFVLPSLAEAFGIATIEAMACGLPVVVSDAGGTADIVDHGINGFITTAGDSADLESALETLLADAGRRRSMGVQSRRIAEERFDLEKTARVPLGLLADLAARHRRNRGT